MFKRFCLLFLSTVALFLHAPQAFACLHPYRSPSTKKVSHELKQAAQQALILHHQGVEDLFLKIN